MYGGENQHTYLYGLEPLLELRGYDDGHGNSRTQYLYFVHDGHGSVRAVTDQNGAVTDTYDYDAFGVLTHSTGTSPNTTLFAGEQFDPDLGLYFNRARYLNVSTGRFWSMDTYEGHSEEPTSIHKYLYAAGDPVDFGDPSGLLTDYSPYGYAIEVRIQTQYVIDYPGNLYSFGQPTGLGQNPLLKPDIFDRSRKIWMDIKPMSPAGLADAKDTWDRYNSIWKPTYQNPIGYDNKLFFVFNIQGILFYTADADQRRLRNLNTFADVSKLLRDLQQPNGLVRFFYGASIFGAGVGAGIAAIANAAEEEELGEIEEDTGEAIVLDAAA